MRVLMCPPSYFKIAWENPELNQWMSVDEQPVLERALPQWDELRKLYAACGVVIEDIPPDENLPDMTFAANGGWVNGKNFLVSNFAPPERRGESAHYLRWALAHGYVTAKVPVPFEGSGDIITTRDAYLYCHGPRNSPDAPREIERIVGPLDRPMLTLELVSGSGFYHGDLAIFYVRKTNKLLYCPYAFTAKSLSILESLDCDMRPIHLVHTVQKGPGGCRNFPLNAMDLGSAVTIPWDVSNPSHTFPDDIHAWLSAGGVEVHFLDFGEFGKSGAGLRCVTMVLEE